VFSPTPAVEDDGVHPAHGGGIASDDLAALVLENVEGERRARVSGVGRRIQVAEVA
jgi:hypothetical protein